MAKLRRQPNLREKVAALLIMHLDIPFEIAKSMSIREILALVEWDHHPVPYAIARDLGWNSEQINHPSNLSAPMVHAHAEKTNKRDKPMIAKCDRVSKAHAEFRSRLLTPSPRPPPQKSKWKRKVSGKTVLR